MRYGSGFMWDTLLQLEYEIDLTDEGRHGHGGGGGGGGYYHGNQHNTYSYQ